MSEALRATIGNAEWLRANESAIRDILPTTWTHIENLNGLQIGFQLKLIGIDWRSQDEFGKVMVYLEKTGMLQRQNGYQVRANHRSIFTPTPESSPRPAGT